MLSTVLRILAFVEDLNKRPVLWLIWWLLIPLCHADIMAREAYKAANGLLNNCRPRAFSLDDNQRTAELVKGFNILAFVIFTAGHPNSSIVYREAEELINRF